HRRQPRLQGGEAIDAPFREGIEIGHLRGLEAEVALRVHADPSVGGGALQGDELFEQAIHRDSLLVGHRNPCLLRSSRRRWPTVEWTPWWTPASSPPGTCGWSTAS